MAKRSKPKGKRDQEPAKYHHLPAPPAKAGACPACGRPIVWVEYEGHRIPCDPQRRLVIFAGPYGDNGLPEEALVVFCERTGRPLWGRSATRAENERYASQGNPGEPFAIGRENHWTNTCTRLGAWLTGEATVSAAPPR